MIGPHLAQQLYAYSLTDPSSEAFNIGDHHECTFCSGPVWGGAWHYDPDYKVDWDFYFRTGHVRDKRIYG